MSSRRRRKPSPLAEAAAFWLIVAVVGMLVAFAAFRVGRDWLGKRLGGVEMAPGAPRIMAQTRGEIDEARQAEREAQAPGQPEVTMEDREPTPAERRRVLEEQAQGEPQDGPGLYGYEPPDHSPPATDPDPSPVATDSAGKWVVTAGAYADEENAAKNVARLAAQGYKPFTEAVTVDGRQLTRVNVAVMSDRSRAEALRDELLSAGMTAGIAPAQ